MRGAWIIGALPPTDNPGLGYPSNRSTTVSRDDAFPVMAPPPWSFSGVLTSGTSFSRAIRLGPVDEGFEAGRAAQLRSNGYPRSRLARTRALARTRGAVWTSSTRLPVLVHLWRPSGVCNRSARLPARNGPRALHLTVSGLPLARRDAAQIRERCGATGSAQDQGGRAVAGVASARRREPAVAAVLYSRLGVRGSNGGRLGPDSAPGRAAKRDSTWTARVARGARSTRRTALSTAGGSAAAFGLRALVSRSASS